jgi:hypothetical protein
MEIEQMRRSQLTAEDMAGKLLTAQRHVDLLARTRDAAETGTVA